MRRLIRSILVLSLLLWTPLAVAGTLRLRDGRIFEGDLRFETADWVQVVPRTAGEFPLSFKLSDVAAMTLRPPLGGVLSGGTLPGDWAVQDVGAPGLSGSADYSQGEFTLRGEGTPPGVSNADAFHFVYHRLPSDGQLIARVQLLSARDSDLPDLDPQAGAGLMIRLGLDPSERFRAIGLTAGEGVKFTSRRNLGTPGSVAPVAGTVGIKAPYWLKLTRFRNRLVAAISPDGKKWQIAGEEELITSRDVYIGLFVSGHRADQRVTAVFDHVRVTIHGLQAEYFADPEFKDLRLTRTDPNIDFQWTAGPPDPSLSPDHFSVRWTGRLVAPSTDAYHFFLMADTAARLYINDKIIVDTRSGVPHTGIVNLVSDKSYEVKVDYYAAAGNPSCKWMWSSVAQPEAQIIPSENLYYTPPLVRLAQATDAPPSPSSFAAARGLLLVDGSFLPGSSKSADDKSLVFMYRERKELPLSLDKVAQLIFHPQPLKDGGKTPPKAPGLLTLAGDFIEGDCQQISDGVAKLSSVVFGVSAFNTATQVAAIFYREPTVSAAPWTLRTTSGGAIQATSFRMDQQKVWVEEPLLGSMELKLSEVTEISRETAKP